MRTPLPSWFAPLLALAAGLSIGLVACLSDPLPGAQTCASEQDCPGGYTCGADQRCRQTCTVRDDCAEPEAQCVSGLCTTAQALPDAGQPQTGDAGLRDLGLLDLGQRDLGALDGGDDAGVSCSCTSPPPAECVQGDSVFRTYQSIGSCDPMTGACTYAHMDVRCPDCQATCLQPCDGVVCDETNGGCRSGGFCMPSRPGQPPECLYQDAPDGAACDINGVPGMCLGARCIQCTVAADCNDNNECTADSCNAMGLCENTPRMGSCNDNNACTLGETCVNGQCTGGKPTMCNSPPGQCYGAGSCNPMNGQCNYPPSPAIRACNDGNLCTHTDRCDGAGGCSGVPYTCSGGGACSGQGTCDGSGGCIGGGAGAPTGLSPSGVSVSTQDVTLRWDACASAVSYEIDIDWEQASGAWAYYFDYTNEPNNSKTFFPCSNAAPALPCNGNFRFRVRAYDGSGFGPWSPFVIWRWNSCRAC